MPSRPGYFSLLLHAHLPFVRHPEHEHFLEENWLFEAITETYIPLLQILQRWRNEAVPAQISLSLSPTLCAMLNDELLQRRYLRQLESLLEFSQKEVFRTLWEGPFNELARFYEQRLKGVRETFLQCQGSLVPQFKMLQEAGQIEILTCAATHAVLPLLASHPASVRAQLLVARDSYRSCFGCDPQGIWLPECAYFEGLEVFLAEAGLRWFALETHGVTHARPRPRYGILAPILCPPGVAAFGRDPATARQVWSRNGGYPGDPRYREFYRDAGFDLDFDYVRPYLGENEQRNFTGLKYHRITGSGQAKEPYHRAAALSAVEQHATHFLEGRCEHFHRIAKVMEAPPLLLAPYDAELFGHWWYEGPEFLDLFVRKAAYDQNAFRVTTPSEYLRRHPTHQVAVPSASSWGEAGYWHVWLNEKTQWIYPHLQAAQKRMSELAQNAVRTRAKDGLLPLHERALQQAGRELLLAQASDWPFIIRAGTSPGYATGRIQSHLVRFNRLQSQLTEARIDEPGLAELESSDNLFPELNWEYWCEPHS